MQFSFALTRRNFVMLLGLLFILGGLTAFGVGWTPILLPPPSAPVEFFYVPVGAILISCLAMLLGGEEIRKATTPA